MVIGMVIGCTVTFFIQKQRSKNLVKKLTLEVEELKLQKMEALLEDLGDETDYLTKYLRLYEAGFVDHEIVAYIGTNK